MAKVNAKYEAMVVFSLAKGEDAVKELIEKFLKPAGGDFMDDRKVQGSDRRECDTGIR